MDLHGQTGVSTFNRFQPLAMEGQAGQPMSVPIVPIVQSTSNLQYGHAIATGTFDNMSADEKLSHILVKLTNIESVQGNMCRGFETFDSSMRSMNIRVDKLDTRMDAHSKMLRLLAYKSIDSEARSRRNNLIFKGIADDENSVQRGPQDCVGIIKRFLETEMDYENPDNLPIERAHRLGQHGYYVRGVYTRPIIVAFRDFADTEEILYNTYRLRRTAFSIARDYPKEIADARKRLYPQLKSARDESKKPVIKYPARLVVNGQTVDDMFPDWYDIMKLDRLHLCHKLTTDPRERNIYSTSTVNDNTPAGRQDDFAAPPRSTISPGTQPVPATVPAIAQNGSVWAEIVARQNQPDLSRQPQFTTPPPMYTGPPPPVSRMENNNIHFVDDRSCSQVVTNSSSSSSDSTAFSPSILQPPRDSPPQTSTPNNIPHHSPLVNGNTHVHTTVNNNINNAARDTMTENYTPPRAQNSANSGQANRRQSDTRDRPRDTGGST